MDEIPIATKEFLNEVLERFSPGLRYVCAYGSGIFKQAGHKSISDNMIDLIFVVNNSKMWHQQNLLRFPHHYSFLKHLNAVSISHIQQSFGARMYYNTRIVFNDRLIKYGVIDIQDFYKDLSDWNHLYLAGRLHKPVYELKGSENKDIFNTLQENLRHALQVSLLLHGEKISYKELFLTIASFSYLGDLRMIVGEDKKKVENIVLPKIENFKHLYKKVLVNNPNIHLHHNTLEQDLSYNVQAHYLRNLPKKLKYMTFSKYKNIQDDEINYHLSNRTVLRETLTKNISRIVRTSSTKQTIKGVFTAGINKSVLYSLEKLRKMLKSIAK